MRSSVVSLADLESAMPSGDLKSTEKRSPFALAKSVRILSFFATPEGTNFAFLASKHPLGPQLSSHKTSHLFFNVCFRSKTTAGPLMQRSRNVQPAGRVKVVPHRTQHPASPTARSHR
jgi:hypothetical protein